MPKITFQSNDGQSTDVDVPVGWSVMEAARHAGIDGIIAECGGNAICGTCHVQVSEQWSHMTGPIESDEQELLELVPDRTSGSRLSCQVSINEELDGLQVRVPSRQLEF